MEEDEEELDGEVTEFFRELLEEGTVELVVSEMEEVIGDTLVSFSLLPSNPSSTNSKLSSFTFSRVGELRVAKENGSPTLTNSEPDTGFRRCKRLLFALAVGTGYPEPSTMRFESGSPRKSMAISSSYS